MWLCFQRETRARYCMSAGLPTGADQSRFLLRSKRHIGRCLVDESCYLLAVAGTGGTLLGFLLAEDFATHNLVHPFATNPARHTAPV